MKITQISVHAETRFNDRHEQFRNHCPSITLTAEVSDVEDVDEAICKLQALAASYLQNEREDILNKRRAEQAAAEKQERIENGIRMIDTWRRELRYAVARLDAEKARDPVVQQAWVIEDATRSIANLDENIARGRAKLAELGYDYRDEQHPINVDETECPF